MASLAGRPMAYHVLVAFSFTLLTVSVSLRDSNKEKGSYSLGVGTAGQLWHFATDWITDSSSRAAPDNSSSNSSASAAVGVAVDAAKKTPDGHEVPADASIEKGHELHDDKNKQADAKKLKKKIAMAYNPNDYEDTLWDYNPFRMYAKGGKDAQINDLDCPDVDEFGAKVKTLKRPYRHMCLLRYVILRYCDLPKETCTSCKCDEHAPDDPAHIKKCPLAECYERIPLLWAKAYIVPTIAIVLAHMILAPAFDIALRYAMAIPMVHRFILLYIGTQEKAPARSAFRIYLLVIQIFASMATVICFCVMDMIEPSEFPWMASPAGGFYCSIILAWFQFIMNVQMLVNYYVTWFKNGFRWNGVLTANMLIDAATVHRTLIRQWMYTPSHPPLGKGLEFDLEVEFLFLARPSMNFHFLRAYRCLTALLEIQDMGAMNRFSSVSKQLIKSSLRLFALVITVSGLTTLLEWFGHDQNLNMDTTADIGECKNQSDMKTNIACMPFLVGIYWVFTTISTVGYGDFAPHSAVSYLLVIVTIVGGVTFFSLESSTLVEVMSLENNGLAPCSAAKDHVVVSGGAMRDVDEYVMNHFIHQLLHKAVTEQGGEWPFCCLLGKVGSADQVIKFLDKNLSLEMKRHVQFCNEDPLKPQGLDLAKVETANIVYILPSSKATDFDREDEYNIHVALSIKSCGIRSQVAAPVPFRLVLFKPSSLELAITNGIHPGQCLCLDQLRTAIMAQASEVRGWPCLLMGLTNNAIYDPLQFDDFCSQSLFPEDYGSTCESSLFGFAVSKTVAGKPFYELAHIIYQATGALLICAQIEGKVVDFPWQEVIAPDTVVFAIHNKDLQLAYDSGKFCSPIDWRPLFTSRRASSFAQRSWTKEQGAELDLYIKAPPATVSAETISEEDLEAHRLKAEAIKHGANDFILVIMTAVENYWQLLCMYIEKLPIIGAIDDKLGGFSCIAFVDKPPPKNIVEHLNANRPNFQFAFFVGNWMQPENLQTAGAEQAKVIITFEVNSLRATPDNDTRTFFLLRLIARMQLRPECNVMSELTSGMSGAHMIPLPRSMAEQGELLPKQPKELEEDCFNTSCAAGQVFVPRSLLGLVAKSYYVFGIVEAIQNVTFNQNGGKRDCRPVQISLPEALWGKFYGEIVESLLLARVGPQPAACIGILRETLYSEAVMLLPQRSYRITKADLLIVLATGYWVEWAQEAGLRCFGGRSKRTANGT